MNKKKNELIFAVVLILIFVSVVISNFKPKKSKRAKKPEVELNKRAHEIKDKKKSDSGGVVDIVSIKISKEIIEAQEKRKTLEWGRDPFYQSNKTDVSFSHGLALTGISIGKDKKGLAIIDGEIVAVGDVIGEYSILEIEKGRVLMEKDGEKFYKILTQD